MKLGLDSRTFRWFRYGVEIKEEHPNRNSHEYFTYFTSLHASLIGLVLTSERFYGEEHRRFEAVKEVHAEYEQIVAVIEQLERGEQHETTPIDATGQTYLETPGRFGQDAAMAM